MITLYLDNIQGMDITTMKFREVENVQLSDTIVSISASSDYFVVGTLDDQLSIWKNQFSPFSKEPILKWGAPVCGIIDTKFSNNSTHIAVSSMDSFIRIWDIELKESTNIECPVMSAWKLTFMRESLVTCGDLGAISFYDPISKEITKKLNAGDVFLTAITKSNAENLLAVGNNNGEVYIFNTDNKDKAVSLKPHYQMIRSMCFTEDSSKLLTCSDDSTIKVIDIASEKVISSLEGHKEAVTCIRSHSHESRVAFSCSFDKSIKSWDTRTKVSFDSFQTGSALWSLEATGKNVIAGGECGVLSVYSLQ